MVLALVIGPVMYIMPSAREKRIAELRRRAMAAGLKVKLSRLPKLDPQAEERVSAAGQVRTVTMECAAYQRTIDATRLADVGELLLLRVPATPTIPFKEAMSGWAIAPGHEAAWQAMQAHSERLAAFSNWLQELPQEVLGAGFDSRFVSCYWRENAEAQTPIVDDLARLLKAFAQTFCEA